MSNVLEFVKIRRGDEAFWSVVVKKTTRGMKLRCDNQTVDPQSPKYGEEFLVSYDEEIIDRRYGQPKLRVVR